MKTYDEVFENVMNAANAHRRKVKKIQNAISASVVCAVCVVGASMYVKLEKPESVPPQTETVTTTTTTTITETIDTANTDIFTDNPTELTHASTSNLETIPAGVNSGVSNSETNPTTLISDTAVSHEIFDNSNSIEDSTIHSEEFTNHTNYPENNNTSSATTQTVLIINTESNTTFATRQTITTTATKSTQVKDPTEPTAITTATTYSNPIPETTELIVEPSKPTEYTEPQPSENSTEAKFTTTLNTGTIPLHTYITESPTITTTEATTAIEGTTAQPTETTTETTTTETTTAETTTTTTIIEISYLDGIIILPEDLQNYIGDDLIIIDVYINTDIEISEKQTITAVVTLISSQ